MKRIIAASLLLFSVQLLSAQVNPQQPQELSKNRIDNKKQRGGGMHARKAMMKELNLTEDQKTRLRELNAGNKEKKQAIQGNSQLTEEQKKEQLKEIRKTEKDNLKQVLTDEQKTKMKELRMKRRDMKRNGQMKPQTEPAAAPQQ